jgi:hypothetical protein
MRMIVSIVTAAMLLVHALVGCCCGHHESYAGICESTTQFESLSCGCCHHDHVSCHDEHEHGRAPAPCKCKLECKATCIFLPPEKSHLDDGQTNHCSDVVADARPAVTIQATTGCSSWGVMRLARAWEPPLRLHLLHQSILV